MKNVLVVLFVIVVDLNSNLAQQCSAGGMRKLDSTVAKLMTIGNSGRRFPEDKAKELRTYCRENRVYTKDIEKYKNKCMEGLPKQVTAIMVYSLKNSISKLCNKDSKNLDDLIASTKCINTATPEINKCYTNLIDSILGTVHAEDNKKIPHLCCEYFKIFPCIQSRAGRISVCNEQHITTAMNFVRSLMGSAIDLLCSEYTEGSDKCDILGRPPRKRKNQRRTKSFVVPLLDMFNSFPEV